MLANDPSAKYDKDNRDEVTGHSQQDFKEPRDLNKKCNSPNGAPMRSADSAIPRVHVRDSRAIFERRKVSKISTIRSHRARESRPNEIFERSIRSPDVEEEEFERERERLAERNRGNCRILMRHRVPRIFTNYHEQKALAAIIKFFTISVTSHMVRWTARDRSEVDLFGNGFPSIPQATCSRTER